MKRTIKDIKDKSTVEIYKHIRKAIPGPTKVKNPKSHKQTRKQVRNNLDQYEGYRNDETFNTTE